MSIKHLTKIKSSLRSFLKTKLRFYRNYTGRLLQIDVVGDNRCCFNFANLQHAHQILKRTLN